MIKLRLSNNRLRRVGAGKVLLAGDVAAAGTGSAAASIALVDVPKDLMGFQRVGTSKDIVISATYTGAPSALQARVVDADSGAGAMPWTTFATAPSGGTATGTLTVPQGGMYKLQVRDSVNQTLISTGANRFGVGAFIAPIGQSNMAYSQTLIEWYPLGGKTSIEFWNGAFSRVGNILDSRAPNTLYTAPGGYSSGFTTPANGHNGDGLVYFANLMAEGLGVPVFIVNRAVPGTSIDRAQAPGGWQAGQPAWEAFKADMLAAGGEFEAVIWYQGEDDAHNMTKAQYTAKLANVHAQCKTLSGRNDLKFGLVSLAPTGGYGSSVEGDFGRIRAAQMEYANSTPYCFVAGSAYFGNVGDGVHLTAAEQSKMGRIYAKSLLAQYGIGSSGSGPRVTGATRSGAVITVTVAHSGGTALTDGAGGTGTALTTFQVYDNGVAAAIASTAITSATTIRLTLSAVPAGTVTLSNAMQQVPTGAYNAPVPAGYVADNALYYNSTIGCPLQPLDKITVTGS